MKTYKADNKEFKNDSGETIGVEYSNERIVYSLFGIPLFVKKTGRPNVLYGKCS